MNLIERRRNLLVFVTICVCIVGLFFLILSNRDNVSMATNTGHSHSWGPWQVISDATCVRTGTQKRYCTYNGCGVYDEYTIPATGIHDWTTATCVDSSHCTTCGATGEPAKGHSYAAATCIKPKTCNTCGVTSGTALGHDMKTQTAATCTEYEKKECNRCGITTNGAAPTGHNYVYDGTKQPSGSAHYTKCSVCGTTGTVPHSMSNPTCETPAKCSVCNYTSGASLGGHKWVYDSSKQPDQSTHAMKCNVCEKYSSEAHTMSAITCTEPAKCSVCNYNSGAPLGHDYGAWINIPAAGHHRRTCSRCQETEQEKHTPNIERSTCVTEKICTKCNFTLEELKEHEYVFDNTKQPDQSSHALKCSECGKYSSEPHGMSTATCKEPAKCRVCNWTNGRLDEHNWGKATCIEPETCSVCNQTNGSALGHDYVYDNTKQPDQNTHALRCKRCGEWSGVYSSEEHTMSEATCIEPAKCIVCNWTNGILAEHKWKPRTCGEKQTCSVCGQTSGKTLLHNNLKVVYDENEHWNVCLWCEKSDTESRMKHTGKVSGKCSTGGHYEKCTYCGYEKKVNPDTVEYYDEQYHGKKCKECGEPAERERHYWYFYSEPYASEAGVSAEYDNAYKLFVTCSICKFPPQWIDTWQMDPNQEGQQTVNTIMENAQEAYDNDEDLDFTGLYSITIDSTKSALDINCSHDFSNISYDNNLHWKQCSKCKGIQKNSLSSHTLGKAQSASATLGYHVYECSKDGCEYVKTEAHIFDNNGNCTADGCTAKKVTDCEHDFTKVCSDNQNHWIGCSICGEIKEGSKTKHTLGEGNINSEGVEIFVCTYEDCGHISRKYSSDYVIDGEQNNNTNNNSNNNSNSNNNNSSNNNSSNSPNKGNTTVNKPIPHAGNKTMIIWIIVIATIGIISYIKFKKTV